MMHIHRRLRVENDRFAVVDFEQSTAKCHATIFATTGYTGGLSWDLTLPDFTGVSGWTALWGLANGVSIEWDLVALAGSLPVFDAHVTDGATSRSAGRAGVLP
jgi:hypothetical protein